MLAQLFVLHQPANSIRPQRSPLAAREGLNLEHVVWKTCLRQIVMGVQRHGVEIQPSAGEELYCGEAAYQFVLEVICGLHSPMVGETEVLGQFRALFKDYPFHEISWGRELQRLVQSWLADAKLIREQFLTGHGSQSYGSCVRRAIKGARHVVIVGSGSFVEDLLPWIQKENVQIEMVARNEARREWFARQFGLTTHDLHSYRSAWRKNQVVILAAPISAAEMHARFPHLADHFSCVVDLRGDSERDPLNTAVISLTHVFAEVAATAQLMREKSRAARARIEALIEEKYRRVHNRPFGWDDLCA